MDSRDLKGKWDLVRQPPVSPGQVRPDLAQDRREANDKSLRHQARAGEVPLPKSNEHSAEVATQNQLPIDVKSKTPLPENVASRTLPPDVHGEPEARQPTTTASRADHPTTDVLEQRVLAGKEAAKNLSQLTQGMKAAAATLGQKIVAATHVATHAATAAANLLPKAFWNPRTAEGLAKKSPVPVTTPKGPETPQSELAQTARGNTHPSGAGGTATDTKLAETSAQRPPSPFAAEPRSVQREVSRKSERMLESDRATAKALDNVATGRGITAIATAQEFSAGGNSSFGDEGEPAWLSGKVGAVSIFPIVFDGTQEAVETLALYAGLGLSRVLYGAQELLQRAIPIDQRMANTRDDVPLSERLSDAGFLEQVAFGSRGSVLGPGNMLG